MVFSEREEQMTYLKGDDAGHKRENQRIAAAGSRFLNGTGRTTHITTRAFSLTLRIVAH
jgi:hypothetical protein